MKIFVTGASGFIGRPLCAALVGRGDLVVALSREGRTSAGTEAVIGDPTRAGAWQERVDGCDAVVHLAGEPIDAHRFNEAHKAKVLASRVEGTTRIAEAIAAAKSRPRVLACASGADYYAFDDTDKPFGEDAPAGGTFLAEVCKAWEHAAGKAPARVVAFRTGLILGRGGGALAKMIKAFKLFAGGRLGSGQQWVSWAHLDDAVAAYLMAIDDETLKGPVNLVAPEAVRQRDFAHALGKALNRPAWLITPAPLLRAAIGELAEYMLNGRKVVPRALEMAGFIYKYRRLQDALAASL